MSQTEAATRQTVADTKTRILDAAEALFISGGFDALSMRQITATAQVNLAAVNYHFGSKDALIQAVLARQLDVLNASRLQMLDKLESKLGAALKCEHVLIAMFLPAERIAQSDPATAERYTQFLGRAYTDPSPVVRDFIDSAYLETQGRFFLAFRRTLSDLSLGDLAFRLNFAMGSLAVILSGGELQRLRKEFTQGQGDHEAFVMSRLISLMTAALQAPMPGPNDTDMFDSIAKLL